MDRCIEYRSGPTGTAVVAHVVLIGASPLTRADINALVDRLGPEVARHRSMPVTPALSIQGAVPAGPGFTVSRTSAGAGGLTIDRAGFEAAAATIGMVRKDRPIDVLSAVQNIADPDVLCVAVAPAPTGRQAEARMIRAGEPLVPGDLSGATLPYALLVAEDHPALFQAILRELGALLGLRYEWEVPASAPNGADFASVSAADPDFYNVAPNLIAWNGADQNVPGLIQRLIPEGVSLSDLEAGTYGTFWTRSLTRIFPGGLGYRANIYRCAPDCVMRTRLDNEWSGTGTDPDNWRARPADLEYCLACSVHLERILGQSPKWHTPFRSQKHHFERIVWANGATGQDLVSALGSGPVYSFDRFARQATDTDDFWGYDVRVDPAAGLVFENMRDFRWRNGANDHNRPVADKLLFRDLAISFVRPDGTAVTRQALDLAGALQAGAYTVRHGRDGVMDLYDDLWQEGYLLTAQVDVDGLFRVSIEQSVCLRRATNDFDPTGAVVAIKVYPELAFSYEPLAVGATVTAFHGCVWTDVHTVSDQTMHGHGSGDVSGHGSGHGGGHHHTGGGAHPPDPTPGDRLLTTWFAELDVLTNGREILSRIRQYPFGLVEGRAPDFIPTTAFYAGLFAYLYKQERASLPEANAGSDPATGEVAMEVVGVRHPKDDPIQDSSAPNVWAYLDPVSSGQILVTRERRQGQYDNVHTHGWMGWALNPPDADTSNWQPLRMAPVCGQACMHLHWRWLRFSGVQHYFAQD